MVTRMVINDIFFTLTSYLSLSHLIRGMILEGKDQLIIFLSAAFDIELGRRKVFRKSLLILCNHLFDLNFTDFRLDFENRCRGTPGDASGPLSGKNLSEVVNNIVWVRQLELKVFVFNKR